MNDGSVLGTRHEDMTKGQSERLFPMLEDLLSDAKIDWSELTRIGVGIGPGNFTGIRISVSAARGLALSLGVPAIGVSTHEAMSFGTEGSHLCLIDAKRDRVYAQFFGDQSWSTPKLLTIEELCAMSFLPETVVLGNFAAEIAESLSLKTAPAAFAQASAIARVAATRVGADHPRPKPLYIRKADAAPPSEQPPIILP